MNEKKIFSFYLEGDIKDRLRIISKHRGRSISYLIDEALVERLKVWEEQLKDYNESKNSS